MIVIGCGGRDIELWKDERADLVQAMRRERVKTLFHGGQRGGDTAWRIAAQDGDVGEQIAVYPQWHVFGTKAGPMRNALMLRLAQAWAKDTNQVVEVWALPGGRGTEDMMARGRRAGLTVRVFELREERPNPGFCNARERVGP